MQIKLHHSGIPMVALRCILFCAGMIHVLSAANVEPGQALPTDIVAKAKPAFVEVRHALAAKDPAAVRAFYAAAMKVGAESLHEPRLWPEYHPGYYGAFVRDPDGNNVEAVCHLPE